MKNISVIPFLGLCFVASVAGQSDSPTTLTDSPPIATGVNPCAVLSAYSVSYKSANPKETGIPYRPSQFQACLHDVPINNTLAVEQIAWIQAFVQFQSTLAYLKNPTPAYELPAIDVVGRLDELAAKARGGQYRGEYEFEVDIADIFSRADDGHFSYLPFLTHGIAYNPPEQIVSLSLDGQQLPKIYILSDIQAKYAESAAFLPSALIAINGQDIGSYLAETGYLTNNQDLDAQYNSQFYNPANDLIVLGTPNNGPGFLSYFYNVNDTNTFTFENGTTITLATNATSQPPLNIMGSGQEIFDKYLVPAKSPSNSTSMSSSTTQTSAASSTSSATAAANSSVELRSPGTGFPIPIVRNSANYVSGYFLNDSATSDVAVLVLTSFDAKPPYSAQFQNNVADFLAKCKSANKKKLIIDTRGNRGGTVLLAYDTFKQLFPALTPYSGNRMRVSDAAGIIGQVGSQPDSPLAGIFFDALTDLRYPDRPHFQSWDQLYGPVVLRGDTFTQVAAKEFGNATIDEETSGVVVSGYANNTVIPSPAFQSEDIVLFTDGNCGSTCALFANLLINQGKVRTATVGGRPSRKPMAVIGSVQGGENLPYSSIKRAVEVTLMELELQNSTTKLDKVASTAILKPIVAPPPINYFPDAQAPSVNFLDNIAENDTTQTPLQFTRSPNAECRFFYVPQDIISVEYTWTRIAKGFQNGGEGLCIGGVAGTSPTNGSVGGSTASATNASAGATATTNPTIPSTGAASQAGMAPLEWAVVVIAASVTCTLMLLA